jgi:starch-binding outer membrane protein, SusD/RagB family
MRHFLRVRFWKTPTSSVTSRRVLVLSLLFAAAISVAFVGLSVRKVTQNDYASELVKAYNTLGFWGNHSSVYTINEISSDELVIATKGGDWFDGGINVSMHQHTFDRNVGYFNNTWTSLYNGIVACNKQLYQYSKINSPAVDSYKAELRVLRAFYYYVLLDCFRNVPLVVDYFPSSPGLPASNTASQVFNFIESEINASLPNLSNAPVYAHFNKSAAKAVLAKLYINANVYIGQAKWTETITTCDDIISSGYYNLTPDYFTSFYANNNTSTEIIFQVPYDAVTMQGFNLSAMTLHYASQNTFNLNFQPWNGYAALEDFYNSFTSEDVRKGSFLAGPQFAANGTTPLVDPGFEASDPDGAPVNFTPAINQLSPNSLRQAGARIHKWKYELGGGPNLNNDFGIFRYSDILLLKAEANLRLSNTAFALALVNQIRTRAGLATLSSLTLPDLLAERGREFFAEGWRRQDLIRFGAFNNAWWEKPASASFRNIFPIPQVQIQANPKLIQNPGY